MSLADRNPSPGQGRPFLSAGFIASVVVGVAAALAVVYWFTPVRVLIFGIGPTRQSALPKWARRETSPAGADKSGAPVLAARVLLAAGTPLRSRPDLNAPLSGRLAARLKARVIARKKTSAGGWWVLISAGSGLSGWAQVPPGGIRAKP